MRKRIVNVLDVGADPSGRTDCTEAFRDALARADACGVVVPAGVYRLSGLISGETEQNLQAAEDTAPVEEDGGDAD